MAQNGYPRKNFPRLLNPLPRQPPSFRELLSSLYNTHDFEYPFAPATPHPFDTNPFRDDDRDEYVTIRGSEYAQLISHYTQSRSTPVRSDIPASILVAEDIKRYLQLTEEKMATARKYNLNIALRHSDYQ